MITRITRFFYFITNFLKKSFSKNIERILKTIKLFKKKFEQKHFMITRTPSMITRITRFFYF
jgi:hypothetical protein